jgi:VanZ family protein
MRTLVAFCRRCWPPLTGLALAAITASSLAPLPELPLPEAALNDKLHHLVGYAALALPVAIARPRNWWLALPAFVLWSGAIELAQPYVNRHGEWVDLAANAAGLALGVAAAAAVRLVARAG